MPVKMKIKSVLFVLFFLSTGAVVLLSCEKKNESCTESNISKSGGDDSHNMGLNCMQCHKSGGEGEGCFNAAGTVYNQALTATVSSGTVKFFTGPNGTGNLVKSIAIDSKGNFHTTEAVDVSNLYPAITGPSGTTQYMTTKPPTGACNSCHGVSTDKLWSN
jgi:cytochrome c553